MSASSLFASVLQTALAEVKAQGTPVFTFALYHDHESAAVSVCVDTEANSNRTVIATNNYNMKHFMNAVAGGDLGNAILWQANIGRSLSLGDFALFNVARTELPAEMVDKRFYLSMVQAVVAVHDQVAALSPDPGRLVLACSGPNDEVEYVWSLPANA